MEVTDRSARRRVAVLLSGGVDSAVAADRLVREGHDVVSVHLLLGCSGGGGCGGPDSLAAARRAAAETGVPLVVFDLRAPFERLVVRPFVRGRLVGRTRNPCVACNARLRFGLAWARVREIGAELLASGHYARLDPGGVLRRAASPDSDQSYALAAVPHAILARCRFPLGEHGKEEVRDEAARRGLSAARRPASQDLCFAPGRAVATLVERRHPSRCHGGEVVDAAGRVVGVHDGIHHFTVGQRRGLGSSPGGARYVVGLRPRDDRVIVGGRADARRAVFEVAHVTVAPVPEPAGRSLQVVTRYRSEPVPARVVPGPHRRAWVLTDPPGVVAAPGQLAVWYDGERVAGSGEIV